VEASARPLAATTRPVRADVIGETANVALQSSGASGVVTAVVSRAIYLTCATCAPGDDGLLLWVVPPDGATHPRAIIANLDAIDAHVGSAFDVHGGVLRIGDGAQIDLTNAVVWAPPDVPDLPPLAEARTNVLRGIDALATMARENPSDGLGGAIAMARAELVASSAMVPESASFWLTQAAPRIKDITRASATWDTTTIADEASELLGLGPGLTPSGDDLVGGMLFAAATLRRAYPDACGWDEGPLAVIVERAQDATNAISHALLSDHAQGLSTQAGHDVVSALLTGDLVGLRIEAERLTHVGHTSGSDILAGLTIGMLLLWGNE
jgi:hypothetical protein